MELYIRSLQVPGYRSLLLRQTLPELRSTHVREMLAELPLLGIDPSQAWRSTDGILTFPNGSLIQLGYCKDDTDLVRYLSTEYDAAAFDELTSFPLHHYKMITSRVGRRKGVPTTVMAGTNPVGIGAAWVKRFWITKNPYEDEAQEYNPDDYAYVPATLKDNPHLSEEYERRLRELPSEALREAYLHGSWDFLEGQFFNEFRAEGPNGPWHVIWELPSVHGEDIRQLSTLHWFRSVDWGWKEPTVVGWYCCLPNGRVLKVFDKSWKQTPAEQIARDVVKFTKDNIRGKVRYTVADPAMFDKEGSLGEDIASGFARGGVGLLRADNDRVNGWHRLHAYLTTPAADGLPLLQFWGTGCPRTIATLPTLVRHKTKPEDIHHAGVDDHAADETRYALMSRPAPTRLKETADPLIQGEPVSSGLKAFMRRRPTRAIDMSRFDIRAWR